MKEKPGQKARAIASGTARAFQQSLLSYFESYDSQDAERGHILQAISRLENLIRKQIVPNLQISENLVLIRFDTF
jgi:hypothetical protein